MPKHLYIDTNVYLTFFHFSKEDLKELKKLVAFVNSKEVILYLPEQTKNEFERNREARILASFTDLKASKLNAVFPIICQAYPELKAMRKAIEEFDKNKAKLLEKVQQDAENMTLAADEIIQELFSRAVMIDTTPEILEAAVTRFKIGNPPGKNNSYGDPINWESLLSEAVPVGHALYFISDDKDFYSKINKENFDSYLSREWEDIKNSEIKHFRKLSDFFLKYYPKIELSGETEKEIAINNLIEASTFENAKAAIRKLRDFKEFSPQQLNDITQAFISNNQIYWIKSNYQVDRACTDIIHANMDKIDGETYQTFKRKFRVPNFIEV